MNIIFQHKGSQRSEIYYWLHNMQQDISKYGSRHQSIPRARNRI
jgi:hypothetical protein